MPGKAAYYIFLTQLQYQAIFCRNSTTSDREMQRPLNMSNTTAIYKLVIKPYNKCTQPPPPPSISILSQVNDLTTTQLKRRISRKINAHAAFKLAVGS